MPDYYVKVCPEISEALQKIAFKNDIIWGDGVGVIQYTHYNYLIYDTNRNALLRSDKEHNAAISVEKFIEIISQKQIKVGDYTAVISKDNVVVGCQTVDYKIVCEIYEKMKKLQNV
jgi:hypothetical protein